jgi:uncharacterized tellurite resistance protein B-like protein
MPNEAPFQAIMNIAMHAMLADGTIEGDEQEMLRRTADAMGTDIAIVDSVAELPPLDQCVAALDEDGRQQALDFAFHILISDDELSPAEATFLSDLYLLIKPGDNANAERIVEIAEAFTKAERDWRDFRDPR